MLWTLHNRASKALKTKPALEDSKAIEIFRSLNYDFERNFGKATCAHPLRSIAFDQEIEGFLTDNPQGIIVNLGKSLETQRYRVYATEAPWITVDIPESIQIRERFISSDSQHIHISSSALEKHWFKAIPKERPLPITAQGLFMYFKEQQVKGIFRDIFSHLKPELLIFDIIPKWFSKKQQAQEDGCKPNIIVFLLCHGELIETKQYPPSISGWAIQFR